MSNRTEIRHLKQADHAGLMEYLKGDPSFNLFIIGDLEVFGYDVDFQDVWGQVDAEGNYQGILFRFYNNYMVYTQGEFDAPAFAAIILQNPDFELLQGREDLVKRMESLGVLPLARVKETYFCELNDASRLDQSLDVSAVQIATMDDIDRIHELRLQIESFSNPPTAKDQLRKVMEGNMGRTFYIEDEPGGPMIAAASTTAENSLSAMIVGVCTLADRRTQGLASRCMTKLCQDLLAEGRTLCLFYENPKAGSIYHRLGFQDIGIWRMNFAK